MIYTAADDHGFTVMQHVHEYLKTRGLEFEDSGVTSTDQDLKLEDMIPPVAQKVLCEDGSGGILICGTGIGVQVGANKFSGIRACLATTPQIAQWARQYDKCNILCLVGWDDDKEKINKILDAWFQTEYDGSENRLKMFEEFNKWH
ncbi:MAG: RpiB/LacA/LacB family sugar-phosphate isomerase [Microgenomates group bacterium]